jgi:hypothetical protein
MKMYFNILFVLSFFIVFTVKAQKTAADLTVQVDSKINSFELSDAGTVILSTNDGLVGVFHEEAKPVFEFTTYGKIKEDSYYMVPNSPYMIISDGGFASMKQKKAVINYYNGKLIFESKAEGWGQVYTETVLIPENKLVISGVQNTGDAKEKYTPKIAVYDLETGAEDFSFFLVEPGKVTMKSFMVTGNAVIWNDKILVPTSQGVIAKSFDG